MLPGVFAVVSAPACKPKRGAEAVPAGRMQAVAHLEALLGSAQAHEQFLRLRQAYTQLTTAQPWGALKLARRGSLTNAV